MSKFRIGDEVLVISPPDDNEDLVGLKGIVVNIEPEIFDPLTICVRFRGEIIRCMYEWWCEEESLQLLEEEN